ncbi:Ribose transport system permease protein RbsC [Candidatus Sulfopaludibacter sp. SbA3]|nr:Ribose transport system permease protein RbsC [Candidatus Sulfopaludibacter sp. SbA3]
MPRRFQSLAALAGIVILAIAISPAAPDGSRVFLQLGNLTDILRQISLIGIIALSMTFVILTGGIDLSVGSILALSTAAAAMCLTRMGDGLSFPAHIALAIAAAVAVAGLTGVLNGAVIATLRVQPFIVTLASMIGVRGLAKWITRNENIDIGFGHDVAARFAEIFRAKAIVIGAYACAAAIFWVVLARTVFGRHVRAVGDNETAAQYAGLPIRRTKIWVYTISGLLSGFAGVLYAAENHQGNPNAGVAYELDAIAAVVIGGTPLSGGRGSISGTIVGTLIMGVLTNMLRLNNVDSNLEMMIKAVIIVLAVAVQRERESA